MLFGPREQINDQSQLDIDDENSDESDTEDESEMLMILEQPQPLYASQGREKNKIITAKAKNNTQWFKGRRLIEPPVTTEGLCDLVKAASYLSLQSYLKVPDEIGLVASFLDPRIKNLKFIGDETIKTTIINIVRRLCIEEEYCQPLVEEISRNDGYSELFGMSTFEPITTNDLIAALYSNEEPDDVIEETEVDRYLREPIQKRECEPLIW